MNADDFCEKMTEAEDSTNEMLDGLVKIGAMDEHHARKVFFMLMSMKMGSIASEMKEEEQDEETIPDDNRDKLSEEEMRRAISGLFGSIGCSPDSDSDKPDDDLCDRG